jgi:hypothetical protein
LYGAAVVLFASFGIAMLVATLFGSGAILWTGRAVHATERDGIITYVYKGTSYTMDDSGSFATRGLTVYLDPSNPSTAVVDTTAKRALDASFVLGPFAASAAFLAGGLVHRRRVRSRLEADRLSVAGEVFGQGLDPDVVSRLLGRHPPGP